MKNSNHLSGENKTGENTTGEKAFQLIVITSPDFLAGEVALLEGLLEKGLQKLHIRKPAAREEEIGLLLSQLSPACYSRLVLHGSHRLADRFGIPQIHCPLNAWKNDKSLQGNKKGQEIIFSTSLHSRQEVKEIDKDLAYAFMSPLFDSISKLGYKANVALWQDRPVDDKDAVKDLTLIGLGGINKDLLPLVIHGGWDGAAVLGCIWEVPKMAVGRFVELQALILNKSGKGYG
ncbi:thiamine phosphate synthase [Flavitalea flava]